MTKDVLVKISGLQFAEDQDNGPVEIITTGNYYKKNGKHYILYDEVQEGFDGVTKSVIKVNETEDNIDIKVDYKLEVNYEHLAECSISMNIMSKDTKDFRI